MTETGRAIHACTIDVSTQVADHLTAGISDAQLELCLALFQRIEDNQRRPAKDAALT